MRAIVAGMFLRTITVKSATVEAQTSEKDIQQVRSSTLRFIESMRFRKKLYGCYRFAEDLMDLTLYSSINVFMIRRLHHDLDIISKTERNEWIEYLQSHQDEDGLYRDPLIFGEGWYKDEPEWCGRRHLTCHVLTALTYLVAIAGKLLRMLEPFNNKPTLVECLEASAASAIPILLDWFSRYQINPDIGLWGSFDITEQKISHLLP